MKKILVAVLALTMCATLCLSHAAFAENFVEVDRTDRNISFLDADSIKDEGDYITALTKITLRTPEQRARFKEKTGLDAHYILITMAYNKAAREDQLLSANVIYGYETVGSETKDFSAEGWRAIPDGTIGAIVYDKIMEATNNTKR